MATPVATSFDTNPDTDLVGATSEDVDMTSSAPQNATDASMATTVANTNPNAANGVSMNVPGENGLIMNGGVPGDIEMRVPRRERNLREFLGMMDEYAPIVSLFFSSYHSYYDIAL